MWITDLQVALNELFEIYGLHCCIERISNNLVVMSNKDLWLIADDGHIKKI